MALFDISNKFYMCFFLLIGDVDRKQFFFFITKEIDANGWVLLFKFRYLSLSLEIRSHLRSAPAQNACSFEHGVGDFSS